MIDRSPDPPDVTLSAATNMSCEVEANPPARVLWSVDGLTVTPPQVRPGNFAKWKKDKNFVFSAEYLFLGKYILAEIVIPFRNYMKRAF